MAPKDKCAEIDGPTALHSGRAHVLKNQSRSACLWVIFCACMFLYRHRYLFGRVRSFLPASTI